MTTGIVTQAELFSRHSVPPGFPERPDRLVALEKVIMPFFDRASFQRLTPAPAPRESVAAVHQESVIESIEQACEQGHKLYRGSSDLPLSHETFRTALLASGAAISAVDEVMAGKLKNAFCAVRPPGHHAFSDHPEGFCFLNNVAIAARHLINTYGLERVAILDWDLHHGNGTQEIFFGSDQVLFISIHGDPSGIYPGRSGYSSETGEGKGENFNLNIPLSRLSGDKELLEAWRVKALPRLREFNPQFLLVSAGFDAHAADPFRYLRWSSEAYEILTRDVRDLAEKYCGGRLVSILEGGYSIEVLQDVVPRHLKFLAGEQLSI